MFEARNNEKCLDNFRRLSPKIADYIYAPKVYWDLSTSRLLTMEFMEGAEISDLDAIRKFGIQPLQVSKLVSHFPSDHILCYYLSYLVYPLSLCLFKMLCRLVKLLQK